MKYKGILISVVALLMMSCNITLRTEEASAALNNGTVKAKRVDGLSANGLVYALPKTGLRFNIVAEKVEKKRGDFYLYSERYLGLKDVILKDAVEWRIKKITLESVGVANSDEMFQISDSDGKVPAVQLSEDGVIMAINSTVASEENTPAFSEKMPITNTNVPYTEEMLLANSSAKMAQEAANYIYRLRESRTALLSGDMSAMPPDGEAYAMNLENIDQLENQFLSLFKGAEEITTVTKTIEVYPTTVKNKDVLFRFSSFGGVVAADDLSGSPYYISMIAGDSDGMESTPCDSAGLFYKKPLPVTIKVLDGTKEVLSQNVMMGQFGVLQSIPMNSLSNDVKVQFYPATGAIKSILK